MTQKNKTRKETNKKNIKKLYNFTLPVKGKYITNIYTKKKLKEKKEISKCSELILKPFEETFSKKHPILIKSSDKEERQIIDNLFMGIKNDILPTQDFYTYINFRWLKQQTEIMKQTKTYFIKIDSFRVIQDRIIEELGEMVEKYIKNNNTRKSKQLGHFYNSFLVIDKYSPIDNGKKIITIIDQYIENDNLLLFLAFINNNEICSYKCPIVWSVNPDINNSEIFTPYINAPNLTLDINDYFIEGNLMKNNRYNKFISYIDEIFTHFMGKNHNINPGHVYEVEKDILMAMICKKIPENKNLNGLYRVHKKDTQNYFFDWSSFASYLGYKNIPENYLTYNINYIYCIMQKLNQEWKSPKWKAYWLYIYLHHIIRYSKDRHIYWKFTRQYLQGDQQLTPGSRMYIFGLSIGYNKLLTQLYTDKYPRKDEISYIRTLSKDLLYIFIRRIQKNKWLSPSTKKEALLKLHHLKFVYGSPDITTEDPDLIYDNNNAWDNLCKCSSYRTSMWVKLTGNQVINVSTVDWKEQELTGSQAYIVNAFYTANRNDIFIPQAILQKPFIDLEQRGIEYNLAFIGFTLAHEMSHSLDENGSKYDYKGNLKNWWLPKDKDIFYKKNKDIIKQYEIFAKRDGLILDASLSVGEDLADIVGWSIVTEYLRDFQENNHDTLYIRELSFKALFAYFTIQGRQTIYKEAIKANIETNPHPLEKYRVNCVLARSYIFRNIYEVNKNDNMYWNVQSFW